LRRDRQGTGTKAPALLSRLPLELKQQVCELQCARFRCGILDSTVMDRNPCAGWKSITAYDGVGAADPHSEGRTRGWREGQGGAELGRVSGRDQ
jgi:hypothetical protein